MLIVGYRFQCQGFNFKGYTLLHQALKRESGDANAKVIVEYLCESCPALIHIKNNVGCSPLHCALLFALKLNIESAKFLRNTDESILKDKCNPTNISKTHSHQLPLHLLIARKPPQSEVSDEGDCFCLFLRLYRALAGIKYFYSRTPYDSAVSIGLSVYFLRSLLNADPTIDPVRRRDLNYASRREGMFLPFGALSATVEPII